MRKLETEASNGVKFEILTDSEAGIVKGGGPAANQSKLIETERNFSEILSSIMYRSRSYLSLMSRILAK